MRVAVLSGTFANMDLVVKGLKARFKTQEDMEFRLHTYCEEVAAELGLNFTPDTDTDGEVLKFWDTGMVEPVLPAN